MLIDYFLYNGEIELLKLRYNYSEQFVSNFVICEGNYTFTGVKKDYTIERDLEKCNIPLDKIIILKADLSDEKVHITEQDISRAKNINSTDLNVIKFFSRQRIQRNSIIHVLEKICIDSMYPILMGDIDEFFNFDKFSILRDISMKYHTQAIKIPLIYLENSAITRLCDNTGNNILYDDRLVLCMKNHLDDTDPTSLRYNLTTNHSPIQIKVNEELDFNYGWLFHNMGSEENKVKKYNNSLSSLVKDNFYSISNQSKSLLKEEVNNKNFELKEYNAEHLPVEINYAPTLKQFFYNGYKKPYFVVDFVLFKDEIELFQLRYKLLEKYVDLFVLGQGETNFDGTEGDYYRFKHKEDIINFCKVNNFDPKKIRFLNINYSLPLNSYTDTKFLQKKVLDLLDKNDLSKPYNKLFEFSRLNWLREKICRNSISNCFSDFFDDTIFICSDIDEIINPKYMEKVLESIKNNTNKILKIPLVYLELKTNRRLLEDDGSPVKDDKAVFICFKNVLENNTATHIRDEFNLQSEIYYLKDSDKRLEDLGWHFTWISSDPKNRAKAIIYSYNKQTYHEYPISLSCVKYLESLLGHHLVLKNIKSLSAKYDDSELITHMVNNDTLIKFFLDKKITVEQKISYFKAKYDNIINNADDFYQTYQLIFSYLPDQKKVCDYSANLGIALKAAFNYWNCIVSGYEYDIILTETVDFIPLYQNYQYLNQRYIHLKNSKEFNFLYTVPIQLSKNILESKYEENSLSICLDYIHYLPLADTETLVKLLCSNSETVLFSAANPMQYEYVYKTIKWQSDWIKEFEKYDFKCYEIRDELSLYKFVPRHFKTNLLVFSKVEIGEEVTKPNLYYDKNDKIVEMG